MLSLRRAVCNHTHAHKNSFVSQSSLHLTVLLCVCMMLQVTQTELERLKSSYRQAAKDAAQAKRKYQEASKGGNLWWRLLTYFSERFHSDGERSATLRWSEIRGWNVKIYHNMSSPSCATEKDRDKAKERYIKNSLKLHELHNEYVLSVRAAQVYHQHHYSQIQPALLTALQTLQQEMVLIL